MSKYINPECGYCEHYDSMYGCLNHSCEIYLNRQEEIEEMNSETAYDKRKDAFYDEDQRELF